MRHLGLVVTIVLGGAGCNNILGIDTLNLRDGGEADAAIDAPAVCYGTYLKACYGQVPTGTLDLAGTLNTDTDTHCTTVHQTNGPDVCAIAGATVTITGDLVVAGSRPLMLVATGAITVSNKLDASSKDQNNQIGPGANSVLCTGPVNGSPSAVVTGGAGGAAGGSFISIGGGGGAGNGGGAGAAVTASAVQQTTILRGGCAGGAGGTNAGTGGGAGGAAGPGGGAIYLVSQQAITITNELRASGAGGRHSAALDAGGGGGGSGGMIVLEAPQITMSGSGQIVANGGGGGEGSRDQAGVDGDDDKNWDSTPGGGSSQSDSGNGGNGAFRTTAATNGTNGGGGGGGGAGAGGGGGGLGAVRVHGPFNGTTVSPSATTF